MPRDRRRFSGLNPSFAHLDYGVAWAAGKRRDGVPARWIVEYRRSVLAGAYCRAEHVRRSDPRRPAINGVLECNGALEGGHAAGDRVTIDFASTLSYAATATSTWPTAGTTPSRRFWRRAATPSVTTLGSGFNHPAGVAVYNPSVWGPVFRRDHRRPQGKR